MPNSEGVGPRDRFLALAEHAQHRAVVQVVRREAARRQRDGHGTSSAESNATRFRNFSARSSVCRISGRPVSNDSMRSPRTSAFFACASAHFHEVPDGLVVAREGEAIRDAARGQNQVARRQVGLVHHHARREARKAGAAIGLVRDHARYA